MRLGTDSFRGEAPRITPRALPDNGAQASVNSKLLSGDLESWRQFVLTKTINRSAPIQSIYLLNDVWLSFQEEVDFARGVIPGDTTFRTYITGLDLPRWTNFALATSGPEPYPVVTRPLGVPAPDTAPIYTLGPPPDNTSTQLPPPPYSFYRFSCITDDTTTWRLNVINGGFALIAYTGDAPSLTGNSLIALTDEANLGFPTATASVTIEAVAPRPPTAVYITHQPTTAEPYVDVFVDDSAPDMSTETLLLVTMQLGNGATNPDGSTGAVQENLTPSSTSYVYTFVNDLGEESAPSSPTVTISRYPGQTVTITTPTTVPVGVSADYGITTKRIYRAATGASGTAFLFVAEIPLATATYDDSLQDSQLGEALESEDWDLPPDDMRGILALPNGVMAGFRRNQLCLSAQNRPHAWPVAYRLNTDTDIVAIGAIDTTVVICTKSFPYLAAGNDPANYSMTKLEVPQACVSKRSLAYLVGIGVVFASPDGLISVAGTGQVRNLTENVFTREQWQALDPTTIIGNAHDDRYFFSYGTATPDTSVFQVVWHFDGAYPGAGFGASTSTDVQPTDINYFAADHPQPTVAADGFGNPKFGTGFFCSQNEDLVYLKLDTAPPTWYPTAGWTVDYWVRANPNVVGDDWGFNPYAPNLIIMGAATNPGDIGLLISEYSQNDYGFFLRIVTPSGNFSMTGTQPVLSSSTWSHCALVFDPGLEQFRFYFDGVLTGTASTAGSTADLVSMWTDYNFTVLNFFNQIGLEYAASQNQHCFDEVRFTHQVAYTSNFTPPSSPYTP